MLILLTLVACCAGILLAAGGAPGEIAHAEYRLVIGALSTAIVALFWLLVSQQGRMAKLLRQQGELIGSATTLLREIPDHFARDREERQQIMRELRDSSTGFRITQERIKAAVAELARHGGSSRGPTG